ncbi:MAG: exosortase/archaeosortase family protein, partial [Verrucomicrobiota bacterium]
FWWQTVPDYSFGFIVPLFVGYVIMERWPAMRTLLLEGWQPLPREKPGDPLVPDPKSQRPPKPWQRPIELGISFVFGAAIACGLTLFLLMAMSRGLQGPTNPASAGMAFSAFWILLGTAWFVAAKRADGQPLGLRNRWVFMMLFLFPAAIWLISAPLVNTIENQIQLFLLSKVTLVVFGTFEFLGYPLTQQGNILVLPDGSVVGVEDACSGIRSLTACLFAGSFLAAVFLRQFWKKVLMVGAALALAFVMNLFRSLFLTSWAYQHGAESINGFVHDATGYAVLGFTTVGLLLLLPLFNLKLTLDEDDEEWPEEESEDETEPPKS